MPRFDEPHIAVIPSDEEHKFFEINIGGANFFKIIQVPDVPQSTKVDLSIERTEEPGPYYLGEGVHTGAGRGVDTLNRLYLTNVAVPGGLPYIIRYGYLPPGAEFFTRIPGPPAIIPAVVGPRILHRAVQINASILATPVLVTPGGEFAHITRFWFKTGTKVAGGWNLEVFWDNSNASYIPAPLADRIRIYRNPFEQGNLEPKSQDFIYGRTGPTSPNVGDFLVVRMDTSIPADMFVGVDYYLTSDGVSL